MLKFAFLTLVATSGLTGIPQRALAAGTAIPDEVTHLRDPFKKPAVIRKTAPKSDLETYSIDQIKLIAVMTGPRHLRAMVTLPNGKSYLIWENMRIGIRKGIVRRITPDAVHVREQVVNVLGQEENVDSEIRMKTGSLIENSPTVTTSDNLGVANAAANASGNAGGAPAAINAGATPAPISAGATSAQINANAPAQINAGAATAIPASDQGSVPAVAPGAGTPSVPVSSAPTAPGAPPPVDVGAAPGAPPAVTAAPPTTGAVRPGGGG